MAVNINTKFYEDYNGEWHDLSKIVFTSPYLDSPNSAGTRSHILPGRAKLGLWYEDDSDMFRIKEEQGTFVSGTQDTYVGVLYVYEDQTFNFNNDNSVLIHLGPASGTVFDPEDVVYYNKDNYGTIDYKNPITETQEKYVPPEINILNESFEGNIRKDLDYNVYWETEGIYTYDFVDIFYSTDAGITWTTVASGVENDGVAVFNIPETTGQAQLRVAWTDDTFIDNTSSLFSVVEGDVELLKPDSDTVWETRIPQRVWWNSDTFFVEDLVSLDISTDGGNTWENTASGIDNLGYADISLPVSYNEEDLIVKVSSVDSGTGVSRRSSTFSVETTASLGIVYPNEDGVVLGNGNTHRVWWNSDNFYKTESVSILLSTDDGGSWQTLVSGAENTGYYDVDLPPDIINSEDTALFKIGYTDDIDHINTVTDNGFSIVDGSLELVYPVGSGIVITNGENIDLWWNSEHVYDNANINTYLSTDGGSSYNPLASGVNNGNIKGLVDVDSATDTAEIKVDKNADSSVFDTTKYDIKIEEPYINIISPISGSELRSLSKYEDIDAAHDYKVWWNTNIPDNKEFSVYLSSDGGDTWDLITNSGTNIGEELVDVVKENNISEGKFKIEYTNDAGNFIDAESETFSVIDRINKIEDSIYDNFNLEAKYAACTYNSVPYFYNATDNRIYTMDDNDFKQVLEFTEDVISKPLFTIKNDNFYIADGDTLSLYEYRVSKEEWRVLSAIPGPFCLSSPSDDDEYLYSVGTDRIWYRLSTDTYGEWEPVTEVDADTGETVYIRVSYTDRDIDSDNPNTKYKEAETFFNKINTITIGNNTYLPILKESSVSYEVDDSTVYAGAYDIELYNPSVSGSLNLSSTTMSGTGQEFENEEDVYEDWFKGNIEVCLSINVVNDIDSNEDALLYINYFEQKDYSDVSTDIDIIKIDTSDDSMSSYSTSYKSTYIDILKEADRIDSNGYFDVVGRENSFLTFFQGSTEKVEDLTLLEYNLKGEGSGDNYIAYIGKPTTFRNIASNSLRIENDIYISTGEYSLLPFCVYNLESKDWKVPTKTYFNSSNMNVNDSFYNRKYSIMCTDDYNIYKFLGYNQTEFYKYSIETEVFKDDINSDNLQYLVPSEYTLPSSSEEGIVNYTVSSGTVNYTVSDGDFSYTLSGDIEYTLVSGTLEDDVVIGMIEDSLSADVDYKLPSYLIEFSEDSSSLSFTTLSGTIDYSYSEGSDSIMYQVQDAEIFYDRDYEDVFDLSPCPASIGSDPSMDYSDFNDSIYLCLYSSSVNSLWVYDIKNNSWDNTSESPNVINNGHVCCIGDYVYVVEGDDSNHRLLRYSPSEDSWLNLTPRPTISEEQGRTVLSTAYDDNHIYILVKLDYEKVRIYEYDINEDQWDLYIKYSDIRFEEYGNTSLMVDDNQFYSVVSYGSASGTVNTIDLEKDGIFINKRSNDNLCERQPENFSYPSTYRQLDPPDDWEAPESIRYGTLSDTPDDWTEPPELSSLEEQQPDGWEEPISIDNRQEEPEDREPIPSSPPTEEVPYAYQLGLKNINGTATIDSSDSLYVWGANVSEDNVSVHIRNSILFEITKGECYDCRLTAWDDATHSTLENEMLMTDRCRVTACAFNCYNSEGEAYQPEYMSSFVYKPAFNQKLKGDVYYYGDFDLVYRYEDNIYGDYVIFMPYLDNVDDSISHGVHDFIITFHYSYT